MKKNNSGEATVNMGNPDSIDLGVEIAKQVADGFDVPTELTVMGVPVARFRPQGSERIQTGYSEKYAQKYDDMMRRREKAGQN